MSKLKNVLDNAINNNEKLLSIFITAGYPELESTPELIRAIEKGGADFVEIGIPFSDPLADGPTIQRSSQNALDNGMNVKTVFEQVREIRRESEIPIILMGYLNPIMRYGMARFGREAQSSGVDGFIIPDLLPEESVNFKEFIHDENLGINFLISPNTPQSRIQEIDKLTNDFVYCVSVTGVTGSRQGVPKGLLEFLHKVKNILTHPYLVGFGVSDADDAREISRHSHGIIVGSALINLIEKYSKKSDMLPAVTQFVHELKSALKGV